MTHTQPLIIGLSGMFASGKDTVADWLEKEHNFWHASTSDMIRQEALKLRGSIERPVLHEVAHELRRQKGAGVLVDLAVQMFQAKQEEGTNYKGLVVSGLRSLGEAKAIKAAGGQVLFIDAPIELRYQRMISRQRDSETTLSLEAFRAQEATELSTTNANDGDFNILGIRDMADTVIMNDSDLNTLLQRTRAAVGLE